jgi:geranylgeranyl diphosphate synthase, type II
LNRAVAPTSLLAFLESRVQLVQRALDEYLPATNDCPTRLVEAMRYAVFPGGKRLRPMLTLLASHVCGGAPDAALPAACAVELVHCYSLIHDDLPAMDDDDLRRGRPTCHKLFGEAMAILAGDALLTLAFEVLTRHSKSPELATVCCFELARAAGAAGMVGGQVDDIRETGGENPSPNGSIEMLESMHARKTGALLRACLRLGALTAGAESKVLQALDVYGQRIGLAFQITDDLLDVQGEESAAGKRVGKDLSRGKLTFPRLLGMEASRQKANAICGEACAAIEPLGQRAELLKQLARFILERDR